MPVTDFEDFLKSNNMEYQNKPIAGGVMFIVKYSIVAGKYSGRLVTLGIKVPTDFPNTAPYGVNLKKNHGITEPIQSVSQSTLGSEWEFWSRDADWKQDLRTPQHYFSQVDRWLEVD